MGDQTGCVFVHLVPSYKACGHQKTEPENSAVHFVIPNRRSRECYEVNIIEYFIPQNKFHSVQNRPTAVG